MPCYSPKLAFKHKYVKQPIKVTGVGFFRRLDGTLPEFKFPDDDWEAFPVQCYQCDWCRLQRARDDGVRAFHEASMHEENCFLTLTYNDANLPSNGSIVPLDAKKFMLKLRNKICIDDNCKGYRFNWSTLEEVFGCRGFCRKILSFGCAEYGEKLSRPHYHICIFGFNFADRKFWRWSKNDWSPAKWRVDRSDVLESLWTFGFSEIGSVTFESAAYVGRYCVKKITGKKSDKHYGDKLPERKICVSNRVGIGRKFVEKYAGQLLVNDHVVVKGVKMSLPRYYRKRLEIDFPEESDVAKLRRFGMLRPVDLDGTEARLRDRKKIHELRKLKLKRGYERD